ncbi:HNH endonuclease [Ornithinimicrobium sp. W1665]|uniref:HNH endonuclease n=1 Tax=Ornithinimicrobium sp. W1665 TaxID=3416666 RepID=UPI003CEF03EB
MSRYSSSGTDWERTRARVLARDAHTCAYCGREATTVDHIVAKKNGGTDDEANLVSACNRCNASKGARVMARTAWYDPEWIRRV